MSWRATVAVGAVTLTTGCADPACDPGTTWNGHVDGFFREYCQGCHADEAPDRYGAPQGVSFATADAVFEHADAVADAIASERMPPGGGVDAEEVDRVLAWIDCRAR